MTEFPILSSKTKIICTIGPASWSQSTLEHMIRNGMDIARVNLSHGDLGRHAQTIQHIRAAASAVGARVAIWGDLPGPKMRIGRMGNGAVSLQQGQRFVLTTGDFVGDATRAALSFSGLSQAVKPGERVHLNDGMIQLEVESVVNKQVHCEVLDGGELRTHDGVNLPGIDLGLSAFTDQDWARLAFAAEQRLDAVSPSFIQNAADLDAVRLAAGEMGYCPFLLAKIERAQAVRNLEPILACADAVVVARGDLGIETPIEEIALLQKQILRRARLAGIPAITATHMLESMTHQRIPTRAEVADVTNAILDGTDCLTLSAETALGRHPAETVAMMTRIALAVEARGNDRVLTPRLGRRTVDQQTDAESPMLQEFRALVDKRKPAAILTPTFSGAIARRLSHLRLPVWIVAASPDASTCQTLQFSYGVHPLHQSEGLEGWQERASVWLQAQGIQGRTDLLTADVALSLKSREHDPGIIELLPAPGKAGHQP